MRASTPAGGKGALELPSPRRVTAFVGNFGSGKTEIALNYALALARRGLDVRLADLDIVNPYFRSREAREHAKNHGVEVIAPGAELAFADLPILMREVAGAIGRHDGHLVLDIGGDDLGARVLGGFSATLEELQPALWQVVNQSRPFTDSLDGCRRMYDELEAASRMRINGLVANAHLMGETTAEVIKDGVEFTRTMGEQLDVPLELAAVEKSLLGEVNAEQLGCPILPLERLMTAPWERSKRRGPIGRPPVVALPDGVE